MKSQQETIPKSEGFQKDKDTPESLVQRGQEIISKLSESLHNISSSISHTAQNLLHKVWYEDLPNPQKDLDPKIKENIKKINYEITHLPHRPERVIETQGKGGLEGEKASFLQKAREGIHDFSDRITHSVENLEKKFIEKPEKQEEPKITKTTEREKPSTKGPSFVEKAKERISGVTEKIAGKTESVETEEREGRFVDLAPTEKINPKELKQFHEVRSGFSETVSEFQHEKRLEEVGQGMIASNNPFEVLGNEKLNLAQPLDHKEVVGGGLKTSGEKTMGSDVTNKYLEATGMTGMEEGKPVTEKIREGISETTSRIKERLAETKEKIMSTLGQEKENVGTS